MNPSNRFREDYNLLNTTREESYMSLLRRHLDKSGIQVECTKGEWSLGQQEINVKYTDPLTMADNHSIIKQAAKEIAYKNEMSVTFMSKWDEKSAGSSMHIHLSLWDKDGKKNLFYDPKSKSEFSVFESESNVLEPGSECKSELIGTIKWSSPHNRIQ